MVCVALAAGFGKQVSFRNFGMKRCVFIVHKSLFFRDTKIISKYCLPENPFFNYDLTPAAMAELVDALDSGSSRGNSVDVRVILAAFLILR